MESYCIRCNTSGDDESDSHECDDGHVEGDDIAAVMLMRAVVRAVMSVIWKGSWPL